MGSFLLMLFIHLYHMLAIEGKYLTKQRKVQNKVLNVQITIGPPFTQYVFIDISGVNDYETNTNIPIIK